MNRKINAVLTAAVILGGLAPSRAAVVFSDNFDSEHGGTADVFNYTGFANFAISDGTVDLIGTGGLYDFFPGNGLYVDLDGSSLDAGKMTSVSIPVAPGNYALSFQLAGSQRGDVNTVQVNVDTGFASQSYILNSGAPLATHILNFAVGAPTSINLVFENTSGPGDFAGAILDNIVLESAEPPSSEAPDGGSTAGLLALGSIALGVIRRRSTRA